MVKKWTMTHTWENKDCGDLEIGGDNCWAGHDYRDLKSRDGVVPCTFENCPDKTKAPTMGNCSDFKEIVQFTCCNMCHSDDEEEQAIFYIKHHGRQYETCCNGEEAYLTKFYGTDSNYISAFE